MEEMHRKGQYFTTNESLKKSVYDLIQNKPNVILEPSVGRGHLVEYTLKHNDTLKFHMYEIDSKLKLLESIRHVSDAVVYGDFLTQQINIKYKTIIGNPPFVKTKRGNLYLEFIRKCFHLLANEGELIFIVPSDFIKLTSASKLINEMLDVGTFTHIVHPNSENLFTNASIDVIVFRYCKDSSLTNKVLLNNEQKYLINTNGIITFSNQALTTSKSRFADYFDVFVGMVTGKEAVYKNNEFGNIKVLNGKNKIENYILIDSFPTKCKKLNEYLLSHKETLLSRKIRKFHNENWYEWGAPRNLKAIKTHFGKRCIYVSNITRKPKVAFIGKVQFFGGGLIMLIPHKSINLKRFVAYLNSELFKCNYMYAGRFKIGHKQLCNSLFSPESFHN